MTKEKTERLKDVVEVGTDVGIIAMVFTSLIIFECIKEKIITTLFRKVDSSIDSIVAIAMGIGRRN